MMLRTVALVVLALASIGYAGTRLEHLCSAYEIVAVPPRLDQYLASHGFADPYIRSEPRCVAYSNWYLR